MRKDNIIENVEKTTSFKTSAVFSVMGKDNIIENVSISEK